MFRLHPLVVAGALGAALVTVLVSAWLPAFRAEPDAPAAGAAGRRRPRRRRIGSAGAAVCWGLSSGCGAKLAGCALRQSRRALRVANLSLLLSFLGFTAMLCFFTLSGISTRHTYFERYQDAWDVMARLPRRFGGKTRPAGTAADPDRGAQRHRIPGRTPPAGWTPTTRATPC